MAESETDEKPAEDEKPARRRRAKAEGEICSVDWPGGWPEDGRTASCVHGNYVR